LMEMRRLAPLGDLVERIAALEGALRTGKIPAERKAPQSASGGGSIGGSARATSASSSAGSATAANPVEERSVTSKSSEPALAAAHGSVIDQIKSALEQKRRRLLVAALNDAHRAELEGEEFVVEFASEAKHSRDTLAKSENAQALRETCAEVLGREVGIRFLIRDGNDSGEQPLSPEEEASRAKQQTRQAIAQNPSVQQVLRAFGGEIVDIKMR